MPEKMKGKLSDYEFLIGFVSHEIRNPLSAVIMFSRLLKEGRYGTLSVKQKDVLDTILANASRIEHMTSDFMNLGRVDAEEGFLKIEECDLLHDIVDQTMKSLAEKILFFKDEKKRHFVNDIPMGTRIKADRDLMIIVYDNLLFNAVKYSREGGKIVFGCKDNEKHFILNVYNEGQGVEKKNNEAIFDKFVRLQDKNIPQRSGSGLGLYNVRRIIEKHGGRIWIESEYGRFFNVFFTLPR